MAKFQLAADERVLSTHEITLVDGRTTIDAKLHLTSQRLVVVTGPKLPTGWLFWLGWPVVWGLNALAADRANRLTHQIRRDEFASVEPGDGIYVFRDKNDGYAHVSFAITPSVLRNNDSLQTWQQRMHQWASGTVAGAELPTARMVED